MAPARSLGGIRLEKELGLRLRENLRAQIPSFGHNSGQVTAPSEGLLDRPQLFPNIRKRRDLRRRARDLRGPNLAGQASAVHFHLHRAVGRMHDLKPDVPAQALHCGRHGRIGPRGERFPGDRPVERARVQINVSELCRYCSGDSALPRPGRAVDRHDHAKITSSSRVEKILAK